MAQRPNCHNCVYSYFDRGQWLRTVGLGWPTRPVCGNQPDYPGRMRECPIGRVCRNFRPRPPTPQGETVKTIPLGDGFYTYVDAADFDWLNQWTWQFLNGYAVRRENGKAILMHREIMQAPEGMVVHHKNRNKVDNTRANLHVCTPQENAGIKAKRRGTSSQYKGVSYHKHCHKWRARFDWQGERFYLGYFTEEIEAARAYDCKAVELLGELARVNLPEEWSAERRREVHARFQAGVKREGKKAGRNEGKRGGRPRPRTAGHRLRATSARPASDERPATRRGKSKKGKGAGSKAKVAGRKAKVRGARPVTSLRRTRRG